MIIYILFIYNTQKLIFFQVYIQDLVETFRELLTIISCIIVKKKYIFFVEFILSIFHRKRDNNIIK